MTTAVAHTIERDESAPELDPTIKRVPSAQEDRSSSATSHIPQSESPPPGNNHNLGTASVIPPDQNHLKIFRSKIHQEESSGSKDSQSKSPLLKTFTLL